MPLESVLSLSTEIADNRTGKLVYISKISISGFRCLGSPEAPFVVSLQPGLTAFVGENDAGKTAVFDALRFALGTTDQEWNRLDETDFQTGLATKEIRVSCTFEQLANSEKSTFLEYLTYDPESRDEPRMHVTWTVKDTGEVRHGRPYRRPEVRAGKDGTGPVIDSSVRDLLRATYLRPLRDAEKALTAGRGSRLAQVLKQSKSISDGADGHDLSVPLDQQNLSVIGISKLIDSLLKGQAGVQKEIEKINTSLGQLTLTGDSVKSSVSVGDTGNSDETRIRQLLERLDLTLGGDGKLGLGSNNLLFMACEFLLLTDDSPGIKLLLIEEPEAHLHAQRQLRAMKFLQSQAASKDVQVFVTTHSPHLASAIALKNLVMIQNRQAFPLSPEQTKLSESDYRFLERFLDATKANLFFARGVMIVEGDAENILLPTLARLIGKDFTEYGVSIVNVGTTGLRRYSRVFQRRQADSSIHVPVACLTDLDVMPDCAPTICGLDPLKGGRKWKMKSDFVGNGVDKTLDDHIESIKAKADGAPVKTFVSNEWTLEYCLALGSLNEDGAYGEGLAEDLFVAAMFAKNDETINTGGKSREDCTAEAKRAYQSLMQTVQSDNGGDKEVLASHIYSHYRKSSVSKAIAAQYLAEFLEQRVAEGLSKEGLRQLLPEYLVEAIDYVTSGNTANPTLEGQEGD